MLTLAIPNYNGARYLAATLHSLALNRPHVRWYLQDGASSDDSVAIARSFASAQDVVMSTADSGQTSALNTAITVMGGDIIGFINSDDELAAGTAEAVVAFFTAHPDIDLVYGEVEWMDAAGRVTGRHAGKIESLADVMNIYAVWWDGRQWVQPEVFFRRSLWERVGPFDSGYRLAFDYDFWVRCFKAGARVARLPQVLARFRLHAEQKSRAAGEAAREIRNIVESHLVDSSLPPKLAKQLRDQIDYDRYRLGEPPYGGRRPSFLGYLLSNPRQFALPTVRARLRQSLRQRMPG